MKRLVCIGDSYVAGQGDETSGDGWVGRLRRRLPHNDWRNDDAWQVYNLGIGGDTVRDVDARLGEALIRRPDVLIMGCGGNDIATYAEADGIHPKISGTFTVQGWERLLPKVTGMCERVLVFPAMYLAHDVINEHGAGYVKAALDVHLTYISGLCEQHGIAFLGLSEAFVSPELLSDNTHWNAKGYDLLADAVYSKLKQLEWV